MIALVQTITLLTGLILLVVAGYQDFKTHKPTIIMPAMILIGLSQSIIIGMVIFAFAAFSLFFLPNSVNKVFGKADIFFLSSMLVLIITMINPTILPIIMLSSLIALAGIIYYIKEKPNEFIPWVGVYVLGLTISILTMPLATLLMGLI